MCNSKEIRSKPLECGTVKLICVLCALLIERGHGGASLTEGASSCYFCFAQSAENVESWYTFSRSPFTSYTANHIIELISKSEIILLSVAVSGDGNRVTAKIP